MKHLPISGWFCGLCCLLLTGAFLEGQTVWSGSGSDNNWSTDDNWDGGSAPASSNTTWLQFSGSTRLSPNVDINNPWIVNRLEFTSSAGNFTIGGNSIRLAGTSPSIIQDSNGTQTITSTLDFNSLAVQIQANAGTLALGPISNGGNATISGAGTLQVNNGITLNNNSGFTGTLRIAGPNSIALLRDNNGLGSAATVEITDNGQLQFSQPVTANYGGTLVLSTTSYARPAIRKNVNGTATLNASIVARNSNSSQIQEIASGANGQFVINGTMRGHDSLANSTIFSLAAASADISTLANALVVNSNISNGVGTGSNDAGVSLLIRNTVQGTLGVVVLNGTNSFTGGNSTGYGLATGVGVNVQSGALIVGNSSALGTGTVQLGRTSTAGIGVGTAQAEQIHLLLNGGFSVGNNIITTIRSDYTGKLVLGGRTADESGFGGNIILNGGGGSSSGPLPFELTAAEGGRVNFTGNISLAGGYTGTHSFTKTGAGIVSLSGSNTYTGTTTVSAGTLLINNTGASSATGSGAVSVADAGTLAGTGRISGNTTVSGTLTAGDFAIGASVPTVNGITQADNNLEFASNLTLTEGTFDIYLGALSEAAGYTQLLLTNASAVLSLSGDTTFNLNFANGIQDPNSGNTFWDSDHAWVIVDINGSQDISGTFATTNFGSFSQGAFSLSYEGGNGNDLVLLYTAVPEPTALHAVLVMALVTVGRCLYKRTNRSLTHS